MTAEETTDENNTDVPDTCTLLLAPHDSLDRILVIRSLEGFATHWMNSYGAWISLPDTTQGMAELIQQLDENPELLPQIDMEYVDVAGDEEPTKGYVDEQIPFGD